MLSRMAILMFAGVALAGCDGYARSFRAPAASTGSASQSEKRLLTVAAAVARERGYARKPATQSQYARFTILTAFTKRINQRESVTFELVRDFKDGANRFIILDWPSFTRSDESRAVEAAINAHVIAFSHASNQPMQPTASRRTASLWMTKSHSLQIMLAVISGG
jgi:hypothetical protein